MENCVELARQIGAEIVTDALGLRPIDDTDCALEPRPRQKVSAARAIGQIKKESRNIGLMKPELIAFGKRRSHPLHLAGIVPVGSRSHRPAISRESNQHSIGSVFLANQLADVELAPRAHFRCPRVAQVGVVGPDNDLGVESLTSLVTDQRLDAFHHMGIAKVPRRLSSAKHRSVILFRILDEPGVLLGVEEVVATGFAEILHTAALHLD